MNLEENQVVFNKFRVEKCLGMGAFGEVFLVKDIEKDIQ